MKFCIQGRKHALLRALMRGLPAAGGKKSEVEGEVKHTLQKIENFDQPIGRTAASSPPPELAAGQPGALPPQLARRP